MMARVLSLCSGYGGLEMGPELAGVPVELVAYAETDRWASQVMAAHHPGVTNIGDITKIQWFEWAGFRNWIDILTAGYPCQPFSQAGRRLGAADSRHLWPYVAKAIRAYRPSYVFLENVRGHVSKGLPEVIAELADIGYVGSWCCVRASDIGAPHRRERVFVLARDGDYVASDATSERLWQHTGGASQEEAGSEGGDFTSHTGSGWPPADTIGAGREEGGCAEQTGWEQFTPAVRRWERLLGRPAPQPTVCRMDDGPARGLGDGRSRGGRVRDGNISRRQQLKILGNGVVPQQAALAWKLLYGV